MTATPTIEPTSSTSPVERGELPLARVGDWQRRDEVSFRQRISRLSALLYCHKTSQFVHRAAKLIRERYRRLRPFRDDAYAPQTAPVVREDARLKDLAARKLAQRTIDRSEFAADRFAGSRYCFLNQEVELAPPIDWRLTGHPELPQLWRFQFHYHEYLLDVAASALNNNQPDRIEQAWRFVADWIVGNRLSDARTSEDAWHPFCVARRLPVWVTLWTWRPPSSGRAADAIARSLAEQAVYLSDHLEWDLGGNHLLENLRALAVAGGFLEGAVSNRLIGCVNRYLPQELEQQILEHGEHFERSPMYHALMLDALLDISDATRSINPALSERVGSSAERMKNFLGQILDPCGEVPLLGDSVRGEAPPIETLLEVTGVEQPDTGARRAGPYWIWNDGRDRLLFDSGPVGADELPAHAHCDLLNLQMWVGGEPLVVDSGVYGYDDDEMRRYCRSTAAHNVVQIDGLEQCDVWSRFRMGRRGHPSALQTGESQGFCWATAVHDAYRHAGALVHRWIACHPGGPWIVVDGVSGDGSHRATNRLHFHPEVELDHRVTGVEFSVGGRHGTIHFLGIGEIALRTGWHCPEFGRREASTVLEFEATSEGPLVFGWFIAFDDDQRDPELIADGNDSPKVRFETASRTWELPIGIW